MRSSTTTTEKFKKAIKIAWYLSDTTDNINDLESNILDAALTYSPVAEKLLSSKELQRVPHTTRSAITSYSKPNPAKLDGKSDVQMIFAKLHKAAEKGGAVQYLLCIFE
jgi:hypothetical protein